MKSFVSTENNQSFARHLRQALPYFEEFQGQILVFHLGVFPAPEEGSRIIEDLVLLNRAGLQIILVHGPGEPSIFSNSPSESHFNEIRRSIASANWELQTRIHSISQKVQTFSAHLIKAVPSEIHPEERR
ncbi:MAG: hypothetical protein V1269_18790, partial [Deltaproteobacteria bacterium]|nr:hypothetical protein [Deltaproteobacteria bacterium]